MSSRRSGPALGLGSCASPLPELLRPHSLVLAPLCVGVGGGVLGTD